MFDFAYADDIVILSNSYKGDITLADTFGLRFDASKTKVLSALTIGEQRQAALFDGEHFSLQMKLTSQVNRFYRISLTNTYKGQGLPCSDVFDSAPRLRDVASRSSRRKDAGGL